MIQKLAKMVAIVALALTPLIDSGVANAHGIGSGSAGFHNSGWHGGFYRHYRRFSFGYYGHRPCYLTVYGTTDCY